MGFLSDMKNKLTGGWADVEVIAPAATRGGPTTITAHVHVKGEPIDIEGVTIEIRCRRELPVIDTDFTDNVTPAPTYRTMHHEDMQVTGTQQLAADSDVTFTATFEVPPDELYTSDATIGWHARAVVRMEGNDPDSGWEPFDVT